MLKKPTNAISGVQYEKDGDFKYQEKLPDSCRFSKEFKRRLVPMLVGLLQSNIENTCSFDDFLAESTRISSFLYISILNVKNYDIFEVALEPNKT
jgi:hypothetical protein